jgi:hypothetical protein
MVTAWVTASDPWMTLLQPTCCNLQNRPSQYVRGRIHTPAIWTCRAGKQEAAAACRCMSTMQPQTEVLTPHLLCGMASFTTPTTL